MIELLKAYLQVASGVSEIARKSALEIGRQALADTPAAGVLPVASALVEAVRSEAETMVTRLGLSGQGPGGQGPGGQGLSGQADLEARLAASDARVHELERELAASQMREVAAATGISTGSKKAAAKKTVAQKSAAKKPAVENPAANTSAVKKSAVKKSATTETAAKKTAAQKTAAKRSAAKRSAAKESPAHPTTGSTAGTS